ncbi:hypothetical protein ANCCAN_00210 [Ancylostoma caninum]|uniref:Uncharacterized protein n=1 Tax=Ancylostoma caninum TaxID=29170 RepID=A0A368HAZ9_ANCCA|nr:hypothetical protein ANCCAN_00210 [Ancylostoma caninum]
MIVRTEIIEVHNDLMQRMSNMSDDQKKMFENMRPSLAFRMRTVLKGASTGDVEAAMKIAESQNVAANPFSVADCVEIVKLHFSKEMKSFELEKTRINERSDMDAAQKQNAINNLYRERFGLSDNDVNTMSSKQVSNKNKAKLLADRYANVLTNDSVRRAAVVQHINEIIGQMRAYARTEQFFHGDLLSAYYHVEKHYDKTVASYYNETNTEAPQNPWTQENINEIYFKEMKNLIFSQKNYQSTLIAQDGQTKTRIWATDKKYTGYSKAPNTFVPYKDLLGNPPLYFPRETVASHFQK